MSYNRRDKLKLIIEIQNITLEHTKRGISQEWVFINVVKPRFISISKRTYYSYLATPAKQELKALDLRSESITDSAVR